MSSGSFREETERQEQGKRTFADDAEPAPIKAAAPAKEKSVTEKVRGELKDVGERLKSGFKKEASETKKKLEMRVKEKTGRLSEEEKKEKLERLKTEKNIVQEEKEIARLKRTKQQHETAMRKERGGRMPNMGMDSALGGGMNPSEWFGFGMGAGQKQQAGPSMNPVDYQKFMLGGFQQPSGPAQPAQDLPDVSEFLLGSRKGKKSLSEQQDDLRKFYGMG